MPELLPSACPHDCPSACAVLVEKNPDDTIGRLRGADMPYTEGVICAKVARYAERVHGPRRLTRPMKRVGPKGSGEFAPISWDEALDITADAFRKAADDHGPQAVWPYFYGGTLGTVQQLAIQRLRHVMGYSRQLETFCSSIGTAGWLAGVGAKRGLDPREMEQSDLIILWGCNAVATQVHLMNFVQRARKQRGAKLVVIDPYRNPTAEKADLHLMLRPGSDAALACAVMHVLLRDGLADRDYMARLTDNPAGLEAHLAGRGPDWAAAITGLSAEQITDFARLYGQTKRSFIRIGYGMTRSRNGSANMHAVSCLPAVSGAWQYPGGGAVFSNSGLSRAVVKDRQVTTSDHEDLSVRCLDMSRLGPVLMGDRRDLGDGPPVTAMLIQSCNPALSAPDSALVRNGLMREDLFVCVHEQAMTETAKYADILLPATTFVEHEDILGSYGHTFLQVSKPVIPPVGESRSNHDMINALAKRLGAQHPSFDLSAWDLMDRVLRESGLGGAEDLHAKGWLDCAKGFEDTHFLTGFGWPDGKFRFAPDWSAVGPNHEIMPKLPDFMPVLEEADEAHPFRMIAPPSRHFLNTSFSDAETSRKQARRPTAMLHPADCAKLGLADGDEVRVGNQRGEIALHVQRFDGLAPGHVVIEGIWPAEDFISGQGVNALIGSDAAPPFGGAVFHDSAVWVRPR